MKKSDWVTGITEYFDTIEHEYNEIDHTFTFRLKSKNIIIAEVAINSFEDWRTWPKHASSNLLENLRLNKDNINTTSIIVSGINLNNRFAQSDENDFSVKNYLIIGAHYLLNIVSTKEPVIK